MKMGTGISSTSTSVVISEIRISVIQIKIVRICVNEIYHKPIILSLSVNIVNN